MPYIELSVNRKTREYVQQKVMRRWDWLKKDPYMRDRTPNPWIVGGIVQLVVSAWLGKLWGCPVPELQYDYHDKGDWVLAGIDIDIKSSYAPSLAVTGTVNPVAWGLFVPEGQWQHHQHDVYIAAARASREWQHIDTIWVLGWCTKEVVSKHSAVLLHPISKKSLLGLTRIVPLIALNLPNELQLLPEHLGKRSAPEQLIMPLTL